MDGKKNLGKLDKIGELKRRTLQIAAVMLTFIGLLTLYVFYLQTAMAEELADHPLNRRRFLQTQGVWRGEILDSNGQVLARTRPGGKRDFPLGEALAPVTGYLGDNIGAAGLEDFADAILSGREADISRLGPLGQLWRREQGSDIILTIDAAAQSVAYEALAGKVGAAVVLDAATGEVLVMASSPSYDPALAANEWDVLRQREDSPFLNRAIQGLYPPGSTIKPLIAEAALAEELTNSREIFNCSGELDLGNGETIQESHGAVHGRIKLDEALSESCNVTFGALALRLEGRRLNDAFERFGFKRELSGEVPLKAAHLPDFRRLDPGDIAQVGIGQSTLLVTPLHMALLAAAFANGGEVMTPYLIKEIIPPQGEAVIVTPPGRWFTACDKERAELIDQWLEEAVSSGTGTLAQIDGVRVTGKTGTAENAAGEDHAWFIGSAQLPDKKIALAVIVENGGSGGKVAAPIAKRIIESLLE